MPLTFQDLIQPDGEIEPDLFSPTDPAGTTQTRVERWLVIAFAETTGIEDEGAAARAQISYVYWRAFSSISRILRKEPSVFSPAQGQTRTYTKEQIAAFERDAAKYKAEFDAIVADVADEIPDPVASTVAVSTEIVW